MTTLPSAPPPALFVTGTDTNVGKTVAAAWLVQLLGARYWKPIQTGASGDSDTDTVQQLAGISPAQAGHRLLPPRYRYDDPVSPHEAARRQGQVITLDSLNLPPEATAPLTPNTSPNLPPASSAALAYPPTVPPLVVEGAGGLLVPLNRDAYIIDLIAKLAMPVVLVTRGTLGTLNHTLLSLQALRARGLGMLGLIVVGSYQPAENRQALKLYGGVPILAELPWLDPLTPQALAAIPPLTPTARWQLHG
ncbi:MAG: dethiobiotin synthase [Alphaproteobacteria bacterium]|nr:dethiobiotin synthase [Alphaproteobacteria bacterium]